MAKANGTSKKDHVLEVMAAFPELTDAAKIVDLVKDRHGTVVSKNYIYDLQAKIRKGEVAPPARKPAVEGKQEWEEEEHDAHPHLISTVEAVDVYHGIRAMKRLAEIMGWGGVYSVCRHLRHREEMLPGTPSP